MNSENINNSTTSSEEISLKELILKFQEWCRYLLSKWVIIVGVGIFGGMLGYTYAYFKKPIYTATTTFVLEDSGVSGGGLGAFSGIASIAGLDLGGGGGIFQGDNILELYKSRSMIEKTLLTEVSYNGKKQLLIDRYIDFNGIREKWAEVPGLKNIQFANLIRSTRLQDSILGSFVNDISENYLNVAKIDKKLSIIRAEVKASDEFFAKAFNDRIVKNVNDFYIQTKTLKSVKNIGILQQKTDSVRAVMNGAIYSAAAITDATPNLNPTRQVQRTVPIQKSQFTAETNKAVLSELVKNLELSKMSLLKETPLLQVIDEPVLPLNKKNFSKLKGLIIGGVLAGFFTCLILITRRIFKRILA